MGYVRGHMLPYNHNHLYMKAKMKLHTKHKHSSFRIKYALRFARIDDINICWSQSTTQIQSCFLSAALLIILMGFHSFWNLEFKVWNFNM